MASLVESGLQNLSYGHADSVGFFQMRASIWDQGEYAGYAQRPELQLEWFLDHAEAMGKQRVSRGLPVDALRFRSRGMGHPLGASQEWIVEVAATPMGLRLLARPGTQRLRHASACNATRPRQAAQREAIGRRAPASPSD